MKRVWLFLYHINYWLMRRIVDSKNIVFDADKKLYAADVRWAIVEEYLVGKLVDPPDETGRREAAEKALEAETGRREAAEKALEAVKADRSVYILAKYANQTIEFTMNGVDGEMVSWKPASRTLTITYKNRNLSQSYSFFEEKI